MGATTIDLAGGMNAATDEIDGGHPVRVLTVELGARMVTPPPLQAAFTGGALRMGDDHAYGTIERSARL